MQELRLRVRGYQGAGWEVVGTGTIKDLGARLGSCHIRWTWRSKPKMLGLYLPRTFEVNAQSAALDEFALARTVNNGGGGVNPAPFLPLVVGVRTSAA